jgi:branched-chain amino acid transport system permease protein
LAGRRVIVLETRAQKIKGMALLLISVVVLALLPVLGLPKTWLLYIFLFFIYLTLANMWNLLSGYCGLISLCQPAFLGLGGYTLVIFTWNGLPVTAGIIGGAIVSVLFVLLISKAVFRLRGIYFAIGTLVVPEALRVIFLIWRPVGDKIHGKGAGYMLKGLEGLTMTHIYWLAILVGIASVFIMRVILSSKYAYPVKACIRKDHICQPRSRPCPIGAACGRP